MYLLLLEEVKGQVRTFRGFSTNFELSLPIYMERKLRLVIHSQNELCDDG
jgi:hypothetical protein